MADKRAPIPCRCGFKDVDPVVGHTNDEVMLVHSERRDDAVGLVDSYKLFEYPAAGDPVPFCSISHLYIMFAFVAIRAGS